MRAMLVLIKREIVDHSAYYVTAAIVFSLVVTVTVAFCRDLDMAEGFGVTLFIIAGTVVPLGLYALGGAQMHTDRNRNISAFLLALSVTRCHLFAARVLAGMIAIAMFLIPFTVAAALTIDPRVEEVPMVEGFIRDIFWSLLLLCLACYSLGLCIGWNRRSLAPMLAALPVMCLIPTLALIKGFDLELPLHRLIVITGLRSRARRYPFRFDDCLSFRGLEQVFHVIVLGVPGHEKLSALSYESLRCRSDGPRVLRDRAVLASCRCRGAFGLWFAGRGKNDYDLAVQSAASRE